jgi:hypothetical protein
VESLTEAPYGPCGAVISAQAAHLHGHGRLTAVPHPEHRAKGVVEDGAQRLLQGPRIDRQIGNAVLPEDEGVRSYHLATRLNFFFHLFLSFELFTPPREGTAKPLSHRCTWRKKSKRMPSRAAMACAARITGVTSSDTAHASATATPARAMAARHVRSAGPGTTGLQ